jgi:hypothetical protein
MCAIELDDEQTIYATNSAGEAASTATRLEMLSMADRIDHEVSGTETWRVARADGAFCMEFNAREHLSPERECRQWLAEQKQRSPGWIDNGYMAVKSVEYSFAERLAIDAAALLRRLTETELLAAAPTAPSGAGVYFASKVTHAPRWRALRDRGVPIISSWIDEAGEGQTADYRELSARCLVEIADATAVLLYCEPGEILKGALLEVGAALMSDTPVLCVGECANLSRVFRRHRLWFEFATLEAALAAVADC